jgi:hypothetical protein
MAGPGARHEFTVSGDDAGARLDLVITRHLPEL